MCFESQADNQPLGRGVGSPLVTVLMPVYNGERYLSETMRSILSQTFSDFEFLIVDDGSTDASLHIIRSFSDSRIRVVENPQRLKLSGALNRGLDEARGTYIARMDADDIAMPERLQYQVDFLESHHETGLCGTWIKKFGSGKKKINKYPVTSEMIKAYALFDCPFAHPTVMIRRQVVEQNNLRYDGEYYPTEDYELWSRAIELFPCANIDKVLLKYRVHGASMTCSDWREMDTKAMKIAERQLLRLGLDVSEDEAMLHRNIGRGASCRSNNIGEVCRGEDWLQRLVGANQKKHRYDENCFRRVVALIWYRLCLNAAALGVDVLRSYAASPLSRRDEKKKQRIVTLGLSIVKNRFVKPGKG